jgi:DNA-binding CsgD family transcriptional regulator/PAS domain-containing protein
LGARTSELIQQSSTKDDRDGRELWEVVQDLDLPLVLTDLRDFTVAAASQALALQIGISPAEIVGTEVVKLFAKEDQQRAREALQALADGTIDFYRTNRRLSRGDSVLPDVSIWVHAIDFGPRHFALTEFSRSKDLQVSPLVNYLGYTPSKIAIGVMDHGGTITSVSSNVESVIDIRADELIGQPLLNDKDRDFWQQLHDGRPEHGPCMVSWPFQSRNSIKATDRVTCLLACLIGTDSYCFLLIRTDREPQRSGLGRTAELEQRLMRIAQEVQASGVLTGMDRMPDFGRFPQLGTLTTRQWEVLSRLLRGERVSVIATDLFVSQSTVRNNLSALFGKFGVHSQAELLHLLAQ